MRFRKGILCSLLIISFTIILFLSAIAWAYPYSRSSGLFGGLETDILKTLSDILSYEIRLPGWGNIVPAQEIPIWVLVTMFAVLFSILYPLTITTIPIFRHENARNSAKAFAIAVSFLIIFGTQFPTFFYKYIVGSTGLLIIAAIIWLVYLFWEYALRNPIRKFKPLRTADELRALHDEKLASDSELKMYHQDKNLLNNAENNIKKILEEEGDLLKKIQKIKEYIIDLNELHKRRGPQAVKDYINKLKTEISKVVNELKTISKFSYTLEKNWQNLINDQIGELELFRRDYYKLNQVNPSLKKEIEDAINLKTKILDLIKNLDNKLKEFENQKNIIIEKIEELNKELGVGDLEKAYNKVLEVENYLKSTTEFLEQVREKENEIKNYSHNFELLITKVKSEVQRNK
ncbi:MAG: hypothetical protein ACP5OZ_04405 [Candidatus Woesearchaeota archaeon]